jgi:hypothetical protein
MKSSRCAESVLQVAARMRRAGRAETIISATDSGSGQSAVGAPWSSPMQMTQGSVSNCLLRAVAPVALRSCDAMSRVSTSSNEGPGSARLEKEETCCRARRR